MLNNTDLTDDDPKAVLAMDLVENTDHADDLAHLVVGDEHYPVARTAAAEKLIKMWEDGRQGGVTLDHLVYVGDHADEPHKSRANQIIRDNL